MRLRVHRQAGLVGQESLVSIAVLLSGDKSLTLDKGAVLLSSKERISVSHPCGSSPLYLLKFYNPGDLSRYFGGEVDISSVQAHSLEFNEKAGRLSKMRIDESKIAPENRIPRITSATWSVLSHHLDFETWLECGECLGNMIVGRLVR